MKEKNEVKHLRRKSDKTKLKNLREAMTLREIKLNDIAQTEAASSWIYYSIKGTEICVKQERVFDALYIRYGWDLLNVPLTCAFNAKFSIQHALSCHIGGYIIHRHNQLRDVTVAMLKEVCTDVKSKPPFTSVN